MNRVLIMALAGCLALPGPARSHTHAQLGPGSLVRLVAKPAFGTPTVGTVVALTADTLVFQRAGAGQQVPLPLSAVSSLHVSRGRGTRVLRDAAMGFLWGAGTGVLLGAVLFSSSEFNSQGTDAALSGVAVGALGTVIGAATGALTHRERWERVDPGRLGLAVSLGPQAHARLALTLRY